MKSPTLLAWVLVAAAGSAVTADPAELSQHPRVGELTEIAFSHDSATVPLNVSVKLGEVAGWARENPDGMIVLDGHADLGVPVTRQMTLALDRAKAVRDRLVKAGVDPDQIVISGFSADPIRLQRNARVVVWGTHQDVDAIVADLRGAGADAIQ